MKADIARVTFDPAKRYSRVLMQQGRVQLEADWNEQAQLFAEALRLLSADLVGPWGGSEGAFRITALPTHDDFGIGPGVYYVDGVRCVNDAAAGTVTWRRQPYLPVPAGAHLIPADGSVGHHLVYLDTWERLVTAAEDDELLEVALGGPDTAARAQAIWQVRAVAMSSELLEGLTCASVLGAWPTLLQAFSPSLRGLLRARARVPAADVDRPCAIDPRAGYRLDENALFRVEVHDPGPAGEASFKWSLDNGSVTFPVTEFAERTVRLATLGRDPRMTLDIGDQVEVEGDTSVLQNRAARLFTVAAVDAGDLSVQLDAAPAPVPASDHPRLRRWDQKPGPRAPLTSDGTVPILEEPDVDGAWTDLGYGVQVQFVPSDTGTTTYRTGDFWLIPARTATGDVVWPQETRPGRVAPVPRPLSPRGVEHRYAPLAHISVGPDGVVNVLADFQRTVVPSGVCASEA